MHTTLIKYFQNKVGASLIWSTCALILLTVLYNLLLYYINSKITQSVPSSIDYRLLLVFILYPILGLFSYSGLPILCLFICAVITSYISRFKRVSRAVFILLVLACVLTCVAANGIFYITSVESAGWIYSGLIILLIFLLTVAAGSLPILFISGFTRSQFNAKSILNISLAGLILILICFCLANIKILLVKN